MELRDLVVTPIIIILVLLAAHVIRPRLTDEINRRYFFPALILKIFGALAVGFVYQFYYDGGDTYNFHTHGSRHIWEAFMNSPEKGIGLLFSGGVHGRFYEYSSKIPFYTDPASFFIIRLSALFDLLTFSTYSATAVCFSVLSFVGMWMFFVTFYRKYPELHRQLALAAFFIPSVLFWGSGLLKDTLMLGCLGILIFELDRIFFRKKISILHVLLLVMAVWSIFSVKKFILQAFVPAALLWIYLGNLTRISSAVVKILLLPVFVGFSIFSTYFSFVKIGQGDKRYAIEHIAETAKVTAYDIRFQTGRDAGSGYTLGELDGSFSSLLKLAPQAINVSLFRPYLWEVKNPLMLLSAIESLVCLFLTLYMIFKYRFSFFRSFRNPDVTFSAVFALIFAFAVGVSSFNFGTLSRYKIPLLPFYAVALAIIFYENSPKKLEAFEETE